MHVEEKQRKNTGERGREERGLQQFSLDLINLKWDFNFVKKLIISMFSPISRQNLGNGQHGVGPDFRVFQYCGGRHPMQLSLI